MIPLNYDLNYGFQEAERKIPLNYASRFTSRTRGLDKSAYLPFKVILLPQLILCYCGLSTLIHETYPIDGLKCKSFAY